MQFGRAVAALAAVMVSAQALAAQDTTTRTPERRGAGMMAMHMQEMDSLDARLDSLVSRMNAAAGERKLAAMADVLNELVAQRKAMRHRMSRTMEGRPMPRRDRRLPPGHPPVRADSVPGYRPDTAR